MNSRHRTSSPASPAAPLDDDDLFREILLRLPPQPSSLPRASLVCTRWRDFVADAGFLRLFRVHHRKAPPLGFLTREHGQVVFTPTLDPPDRIPAARFSWTPPPPPKIQVDCRYCQGEGWCFFGCHELQRERWSFPGCHHGLALLLNWQKREAIVWDPVTGHQRRVAFPLLPGFNQGRCKVPRNSAVVCAASDGGHVHGACHLSPFKFVLVCNDIDCKYAFVCLYESGSGAWGNIIEAAATTIDPCRPSVLVGDALCWLLRGGRILKFDHERQSLAVIDRPADAQVASYHNSGFDCFQILRIEDSVLGLAILFELSIHIWEIKSDCGGVVKWMLRKTIQLGELLCVEEGPVTILGYDEVTNMILLSTDSGDFMVQLESMWFKSISRREYKKELTYHPYSNFYTAGSH